MVHFIHLPVREAQENDLLHLVKIAEFSYGSTTSVMLLRSALDGYLAFWRIRGEGVQGLLVTRLVPNSTGRTLWIEGISGKGLVKNKDLLVEALIRMAKRAKCNRISGQVFRKGMVLITKLSNLPPVGIVFSREVEP